MRSTVGTISKNQSGVHHDHNDHYHRPISIATRELMLPSEGIPLIDIRAYSIADYKGIPRCKKQDATSVGVSLPQNGILADLKRPARIK